MIFSKKMVESILSTHLLQDHKIYQNDRPQCSPDELAEHITIELTTMQDIGGRLQELSKERQELIDEHEDALDRMAADKSFIVGQCPHHSVTSGICDTCEEGLL